MVILRDGYSKRSLRPEMLQQAHEGHLGIVKGETEESVGFLKRLY